MRRAAAALAVLAVLALAPSPVAAHSLIGRLNSPLPLAVYLAGAAMAVALSFGFLILRDVRPPSSLVTRRVVAPRWIVVACRVLGLVAWLWIVAQVIVGGSSGTGVGFLFLWVYGWVGLAIVSALVGPVWTWLDPFATLFDIGAALLRRLGVEPWEPAPYPEHVGLWPAIVGLVTVVWLELVFVGAPLGVVLLLYTGLTLVAMANFGRDVWRARGETFSVWFGMLNRLAPFGPADPENDRVLERRPFAAGLIQGEWSAGHVVVVALGAASILYDGLSQTQVWFQTFGLPALPLATIQLLAFLALVVGVSLAVSRLVGVAAVAAGLVPIAVGYLIAHYLTFLLGEGQGIIVALSDPFQLGWDLFGTAFFEPGTGWIPPVAAWTVMLIAVVGGHVLGAWSGHVVAVRDAPPTRYQRLRQLPLAALMVGLTATTLWSLGQALVSDPETAALLWSAVGD